MKKMISLGLLSILLSVSLVISCAKKSSPDDQQNCKTCKVFGADGPNHVIDEEKICTDEQEQALHTRFPGREIKCQ